MGELVVVVVVAVVFVMVVVFVLAVASECQLESLFIRLVSMASQFALPVDFPEINLQFELRWRHSCQL